MQHLRRDHLQFFILRHLLGISLPSNSDIYPSLSSPSPSAFLCEHYGRTDCLQPSPTKSNYQFYIQTRSPLHPSLPHINPAHTHTYTRAGATASFQGTPDFQLQAPQNVLPFFLNYLQLIEFVSLFNYPVWNTIADLPTTYHRMVPT